MRINPPKTQKPRTEPVKFGAGRGGRRKLIQAVMERGFSKRTAIKAINAVIRMWTEAVRKHDWDIEMPVGRLRVRKTQSNLYKSRRTRRIKGRLTSWTVYNDPYRILWRMSPEEWNKLLENLNPKDHS